MQNQPFIIYQIYLNASQYSCMQYSYKPVVVLSVSIVLHVVLIVLLAYFKGF